MKSVTVRVPAKVNLLLGVGPLRDDGYHDLVNVFHAVSLEDEVTAEPADRLEIVLVGSADGVPDGEDNLAARAARLVADQLGVKADVRLRIRKSIPVAGGMAGGSADAAAALVACDALWGGGLDRAALLDLAARLGSDVPFALVGGTALGRGRGELLTPLETGGEFHWAFGRADGGLPTPEVFRECDRLRGQVPLPSLDPDLVTALARGDATALGKALSNDLQVAALSLRPPLRQVLAVGRDGGALGAIVSGSGPTCAFLAESAEHAARLGALVAPHCSSVLTAVGPVPGASVVAP